MDHKLIQNLLKTTKIDIDEEHQKEIMHQILEMVELGEKINDLANSDEEVKNAKPMYNVQEWLGNHTMNASKDVVDDGNYATDIIANAPDKEDNFIAAPKVIE